jgi:hypothetical protein
MLPPILSAEERQLLSLFKNALSYTLALTTLTEISKDSPEYLFLGIGTAAVILLLLGLQLQINRLLEAKDANNKPLYGFFIGPLKCLTFLSTIIVNIVTQFLSTIIAKYILSFVPTVTNFQEVGYILLIVLSLFWCVLFAVDIDWHNI